MKKVFSLLSLLLLLAGTNFSTATAQIIIDLRLERPSHAHVRPSEHRDGYVWVDGHWNVSRGRYVWADGYWTAVKPGHNWVDGHWTACKGGYKWTTGHWKLHRNNGNSHHRDAKHDKDNKHDNRGNRGKHDKKKGH